MLFPLRPGAGIQAPVAPREVQPVQHDAGGDARAAIGDDVAWGKLGRWLVPGRIQRTRDAAGHAVDSVRLAAPARRQACVDDHQLAVVRSELLERCDVVRALARDEVRRLEQLLTGGQRPVPRRQVDDRALVVAEVAQQPPEPFRPAE